MRNLTQTQQYALQVSEAITNLFREEENRTPLQKLDIEKMDATKFFTGMIMGCNLIFRELTQQDKNNLEFTYLANQLIVQELIENRRDSKE